MCDIFCFVFVFKMIRSATMIEKTNNDNKKQQQQKQMI